MLTEQNKYTSVFSKSGLTFGKQYVTKTQLNWFSCLGIYIPETNNVKYIWRVVVFIQLAYFETGYYILVS